MTAKCAYPLAHDGSNIQVVDYVTPAQSRRLSSEIHLLSWTGADCMNLVCQYVLVMENGNQTQARPVAKQKVIARARGQNL